MKAIDDLGNVPFRANVVRACASKFYDAGFQAKLDTNTYLVGFENGKRIPEKDVSPCKICERMILNSGIEKVITGETIFLVI